MTTVAIQEVARKLPCPSATIHAPMISELGHISTLERPKITLNQRCKVLFGKYGLGKQDLNRKFPEIVACNLRGDDRAVIMEGNDYELKVEWIKDGDNFMLIFTDQTPMVELRQEIKRLKEYASVDKLTGAFNRRSGEAILETLFTNESYQQYALAFLDIDEFKKVNDTYSHERGDIVLKEVAERLKACIRPQDCLIRWAGDEFVILYEGVTKDHQKTSVFRRILKAFVRSINSTVGKIDLSCGFAYGREYTNLKEWVDAADKAMYRAKRTHGTTSCS